MTSGSFRVITFAQSFHWMDRARVASERARMLDPGGAVVHVDMWHRQPPDVRPSGLFPSVPEEAIDALRVQWLGPHRRAGQGSRNTSPSGEDEVFQTAGFAPEEIVVVPDGRVVREVDRRRDRMGAVHVFNRAASLRRALRSSKMIFASSCRGSSPAGRFSASLRQQTAHVSLVLSVVLTLVANIALRAFPQLGPRIARWFTRSPPLRSRVISRRIRRTSGVLPVEGDDCRLDHPDRAAQSSALGVVVERPSSAFEWARSRPVTCSRP